MALRRVLFTLYGMVIGLAYITILSIAVPDSLILTAILSLIVLVFLLIVVAAKKKAKMSYLQLLILIPLLPFALLGDIIAFGFIFLVVAFLWPISAIRAANRNRRFCNRMKANGRFIALNDLRLRLIAGKGTLIADTGHKGPYRVWWTEDDLLSLGSPASTKKEFISIMEGNEHPFNSRCLKEYLDEENGKALLTSIPSRYVGSGKLTRMFPQAKIAKVIRPFIITRKENIDGQ
jgi:hypothetical protein